MYFRLDGPQAFLVGTVEFEVEVAGEVKTEVDGEGEVRVTSGVLCCLVHDSDQGPVAAAHRGSNRRARRTILRTIQSDYSKSEFR